MPAVTDRRPDAATIAAVARCLPDAIVTADPNGRIVDLNPAAEALFRQTADALRGKDVVETLIAPSERERALAWVETLTRGSSLEPAQPMRLMRADGTTFAGEVSGAAYRDERGIVAMMGMARDITARLEAEADAATLRAVVDAASEAIIGIDAEGLVQFFSPSAERLYGWAAEEIIGRPVSVLAPPNRESVIEETRERLAAGESIRRETVGQRRDGSQVQVELSARAIFGADGRIRGAALTVLDLTERWRTTRLLDRIMENAPNAIAIKDLEGRYLHYSARGARELGKRPEDIVGRTDPEVFGDEPGRRLREQDLKVIAAGEPLMFSDTLPSADGEMHHYLTTKFPLPGPAGQVEGVGLIASDVSELRRAAADRAQLAALVQAAPDAIIARDREGRIATWNPGAEAMFGLKAEDAIGRDYAELLVPEDERDAYHELQREAQGGRTLTVRATRMRADGTRFPAQISIAPLTLLDGTWHGTLVMVRDISDLVQAELELREHAAQLERSNADLERFAYAASHDLQEPLKSIRLSAEAVMEAASARLEDDERELMGHIDAAASRLSGQIRGLMEIARVALGAGPDERVPVEAVVEDTLDTLRAAARAAKAKIEVSRPLPAVEVPRTEFSLVLQNLIANALKYRRSDVRPHVAISCRHADELLELHVADNGIGLSREDIGRVFGIFERGESNAPGTGMGLAVARRMLERHGGTIVVESEGPGTGSRFTVRLPVRDGR